MSTQQNTSKAPVVIGIDIGKSTFHLIGQNKRGKLVMRAKVSRGQLFERLANTPKCMIGMEAGAGAHHVARRLNELGHDARLMPAQYVKPFLKGHKNDYRDAEAISDGMLCAVKTSGVAMRSSGGIEASAATINASLDSKLS